jgi:hypothetical protein
MVDSVLLSYHLTPSGYEAVSMELQRQPHAPVTGAQNDREDKRFDAWILAQTSALWSGMLPVRAGLRLLLPHALPDGFQL